jgi:hypothetical protein
MPASWCWCAERAAPVGRTGAYLPGLPYLTVAAVAAVAAGVAGHSGGGSYDSLPPSLTSLVGSPSPEM